MNRLTLVTTIALGGLIAWGSIGFLAAPARAQAQPQLHKQRTVLSSRPFTPPTARAIRPIAIRRGLSAAG